MIGWLEKKRVVSLGMVFLIAIAIFYVSSLTFGGATGYKGSSYEAMIYHIGIFFLFAFFLLICLVQGKRREFIIIGIIMAVLYGISDEMHQFFVPGRSMSLRDVFYDAFGILLAATIYSVSLYYRNGFHKS